MNAPHPSARPIVVLANPENRRVQLFCEAARRLDLPPPRVIAYATALAAGNAPWQGIEPGAMIRIDSPGENEAVERGLIALGSAQPAGMLPADALPAAFDPRVPLEFGRIDHPHLWYRGFCSLLRRWELALEPLPVTWMNHPADIRLLFDKTACQECLERHGVAVPPLLGAVADYGTLRAAMQERGVSQVFVKLRYGSSASGVVAFRTNGSRVSAITSVEMGGDDNLRLYNSLRVREYCDERQVAKLFNALAPLGVQVESWIPKASGQGGVFDLRVLTIGGEPRHVVMRVARGPMTNLHLGNRRGDTAALLARLPQRHCQAAWETCRRVARIFSKSLYLGIDLMFTPKFQRHYVLEVNAFGDLLPGVFHDGEDVYTAELRSSLRMRADSAESRTS